MSPTGAAGSSKLRDVGRTVSAEAATHINNLKKSDRAKQVVEKSVAWGADALEDPTATAEKLKQAAGRLWTEDEKVQALKDRGKNMLENALQDEQKMEKVREQKGRHHRKKEKRKNISRACLAAQTRDEKVLCRTATSKAIYRASAPPGPHCGMHGRTSDGYHIVRTRASRCACVSSCHASFTIPFSLHRSVPPYHFFLSSLVVILPLVEQYPKPRIEKKKKKKPFPLTNE